MWEERIASAREGNSLQLVATDEHGRFVGVTAGIPYGERIRIVSVWVDPAHRGHGVGGDLVRTRPASPSIR